MMAAIPPSGVFCDIGFTTSVERRIPLMPLNRRVAVLINIQLLLHSAQTIAGSTDVQAWFYVNKSPEGPDGNRDMHPKRTRHLEQHERRSGLLVQRLCTQDLL